MMWIPKIILWNINVVLTCLIILLTHCVNDALSRNENVLYWKPFDVKSMSRIDESQQAAASSNFRFASIYGDNMVLQRGPQRSWLWGYDDKVKEKVAVTVKNSSLTKSYIAVTTDSLVPGKITWRVLLDAFTHNTPVVITAKNYAGVKVNLTNVLFGDVWLCSGQSNMEYSVNMLQNASDVLKEANRYPNIRVFTPKMIQSSEKLYDLNSITQPWSVASQESLNATKDWLYFSAVCWLWGKSIYEELLYPIGLIASDWGGTPVEAWSSPDSLSHCGVQDGEAGSGSRQSQLNNQVTQGDPEISEVHGGAPNPQNDSVLWNAMIHPFINMTIYGVIWYQGEQNAGNNHTDNYNCTFPEMIRDWREKFLEGTLGQTEPLLPFGFVQLAPYREGTQYTYHWPAIRWHQTADVGYVPNHLMKRVFMAVAMDLPDPTSPFGAVHSRYKQDVVDRLVRSGLTVAYRRPAADGFQGPFPAEYAYDKFEHTFIVSYDSRIEVRNKTGFQICCSQSASGFCPPTSGSWIEASVISHSLTDVILNASVCHSTSYLKAIRYAWLETPCLFKQCAVYGFLNGLPGPPFMAEFLD